MAATIELLLGGAWTDITSYVRQDIAITHGIRNEGGTADPSECGFVVNNQDGRFTPKNTAGAYYGDLKRGTLARVKVGTSVRFLGEISEFPPRWDPSGNLVWTSLRASGILRRLARATSLESTLTTAVRSLITSGGITGYWPIEDGPGAEIIAAAGDHTYGFPSPTNPPAFGEIDLSPGTGLVANFSGARADFIPATGSSTEFTAGAYVSLPDSGALTGGEELFRVSVDGTAQSWRVLYSTSSGGSVFLQVIASDGTTELLASNLISGLDGRTFYIKIEASNSGSNVAWSFSTLDAGTTISGTINSRTVGEPTAASIGGGTIALPAGTQIGIGHLILATSDTALFTSRFDSGRSGYNGESIEDRLTRLASQTGVPIAQTAGPQEQIEHGPQPDGTLLTVLRAAEKADAGGILTDDITATSTLGLRYITRQARYNDQQGQLVLDYDDQQIVPPLDPTDDDQNLRNDVFVERVNGASGRATLTSGDLSIEDYPDGVGLYQFADSYAVYADTQLTDLAAWLLALGTVDETRYPAVTVDLQANPSLVAAAEASRPGSRLRIENLPPWAGTADVDLQILGWTERVTQHQRWVTFVCAPGGPWLGVFQLDDAVFGELDVNRLGY